MEILGIGPSELVFIVIIALIILGPKDMQKAGRTIGKWLRTIVTSDGWKIFQQTSRELRTLPNRLMRDASDELNQIGNELNSASNPVLRQGEQKANRQDGTVGRSNKPGSPLRSQPMPATLPENKIAPPAAEPKTDEGDQEKDA
jgi:sec-independent protein translocase protein TatB